MASLHLAAQEGKVDVVKLLIEAKAHVNLQNEVCTVCHTWSTDINAHLLEHHLLRHDRKDYILYE